MLKKTYIVIVVMASYGLRSKNTLINCCSKYVDLSSKPNTPLKAFTNGFSGGLFRSLIRRLNLIPKHHLINILKVRNKFFINDTNRSYRTI